MLYYYIMSVNTLLSNSKILNALAQDISGAVIPYLGDVYNLYTSSGSTVLISDVSAIILNYQFLNDVSGTPSTVRYAGNVNTDLSGYAGRLNLDISLNSVKIANVPFDISGSTTNTIPIYAYVPAGNMPSGVNTLSLRFSLTSNLPPPYLYTLSNSGVTVDAVRGNI